MAHHPFCNARDNLTTIIIIILTCTKESTPLGIQYALVNMDDRPSFADESFKILKIKEKGRTYTLMKKGTKKAS